MYRRLEYRWPVLRIAPLEFVPGAVVKFKPDDPYTKFLIGEDLIQPGQEYLIEAAQLYMDRQTDGMASDLTIGFEERLELRLRDFPPLVPRETVKLLYPYGGTTVSDFHLELVHPAENVVNRTEIS